MSSETAQRIGGVVKPALAFALFLLLWQYGAPRAGIPDYVLPLPDAIAVRFWETRTALLQQLGYTALTTLVGLGLALVAGVFLALGVVYFQILKSIVLPALAGLNSIPKIAVAPLLVIWFGLGLESKIVMAFLLAIFPIFVNSVTGLGEIEPDIIDLSRLSGGTPWRVFLKVRLPTPPPSSPMRSRSPFPWRWSDPSSASSSAAIPAPAIWCPRSR